MVSSEWDDVLANASESEIVELAGSLFIDINELSICLFSSYTWFYWFN